MKRKLIPPFLMLFAGAISSIIMYNLHYPTREMLTILLVVLIAFYIIGSLFQWMFNIFDRQIDEMAAITEVENMEEAKAAENEDVQVEKEN